MYSIAICDDDHSYVEYLDQEIRNQFNNTEKYIINKFYSGEEFLSVRNKKFDLIFLDMKMDKIDGINTALNYRKYDQDAILVFCTGIQMPRPEFFDVHPFRYLMKSYSHSKMEVSRK